MKKLIIIPAYNESDSIVKTVKTIQMTVPDFDYIVVNDCSIDNTREICELNAFNAINLPVNLGIGGAVQTGYQYAWEYGYDMAVQIDGDGQHDPRFLEQMARYLEHNNVDMVIGSRYIKREGFQSTTARRVGILFFSWLIRILTGVRITDPTSGLRMVNRKIISIFANDYPRDYPEPESEMAVLNRGLTIAEIPVVMKERTGGVSSIGIKNAVYYMIKVTLAILFEKIRKYE